MSLSNLIFCSVLYTDFCWMFYPIVLFWFHVDFINVGTPHSILSTLDLCSDFDLVCTFNLVILGPKIIPLLNRNANDSSKRFSACSHSGSLFTLTEVGYSVVSELLFASACYIFNDHKALL